MNQNYPIVSRVESLAVCLNHRGAAKDLHKFADRVEERLNALQISDTDADTFFSAMELWDHWPDLGEIFFAAKKLPSAREAQHRDPYASVTCTACGMRYAIPIAQYMALTEYDHFACAGLFRVHHERYNQEISFAKENADGVLAFEACKNIIFPLNRET